MSKNSSEVQCNYCGKSFLKRNAEINRSAKLGRNHYCNSKCAGKVVSENHRFSKPENRFDIGSYSKSNTKKDEYSLFRNTLKKIKKNEKSGNVSITLQDLKDQWENQNGICPITGVKLTLRDTSNKPKPATPYQASIDRIDNSIGYIMGNIRYIALIANYARNIFSDKDVFDFCEKVVLHKRFQ